MSDAAGSQMFPDHEQFRGFMKPCRFEGEVQNLEVQGTIPGSIYGTFFRVMPDPRHVPFVHNDPVGLILPETGFTLIMFTVVQRRRKCERFRDKERTSQFQAEIRADREGYSRANCKQSALRLVEKIQQIDYPLTLIPGKYRNRYTDAVEFKIRSTANTNILFFNGMLLACKEDSPPYAMDPITLQTIGVYDFDGQLPSVTFTAHPKIDPVSGELVGFGYEAKGDGTPDICYYSVSPDGKFTETVWLVSPVMGMIHDFAVTKNWVLDALLILNSLIL